MKGGDSRLHHPTLPPLPPLRQALLPTFAREDSLDQAQRSVGRAGKGSFSCWCSAHRLFCLRPLSCRLCSEAICWCLWERGTDCRAQNLACRWGLSSRTRNCQANCYHSPPQTMKSLENVW